jgi:low affinity Fe/Cu permease
VATAITPLAFLETVMVKGYQTLVDEGTSVSYRDGMEAALKLAEALRKDQGTHERAQIVRITNVLRPVPVEGDRNLGAGATPFMRAARNGDAPAMRLLLARGADPAPGRSAERRTRLRPVGIEALRRDELRRRAVETVAISRRLARGRNAGSASSEA